MQARTLRGGETIDLIEQEFQSITLGAKERHNSGDNGDDVGSPRSAAVPRLWIEGAPPRIDEPEPSFPTMKKRTKSIKKNGNNDIVRSPTKKRLKE